MAATAGRCFELERYPADAREHRGWGALIQLRPSCSISAPVSVCLLMHVCVCRACKHCNHQRSFHPAAKDIYGAVLLLRRSRVCHNDWCHSPFEESIIWTWRWYVNKVWIITSSIYCCASWWFSNWATYNKYCEHCERTATWRMLQTYRFRFGGAKENSWIYRQHLMGRQHLLIMPPTKSGRAIEHNPATIEK